MRYAKRSLAPAWIGVLLLAVSVAVVPASGAQSSTGTITGTVEPVGILSPFSMCVAAMNTSGVVVTGTTAHQTTGRYTLTVPASSYVIWFWPCGRDAELGPASSLYRNAVSYDAAQLVSVAAGSTVTLGHQAASPQGARISGVVTDSDGRTVAGCTVAAVIRAPVPTPVSTTVSDSAGAYLLGNVPVGTHDVVAVCGTGFRTAYFGGGDDPSGSVGIDATPGSQHPGRDLVVGRSARSVSGRLTVAGGGRAANACAWAVDQHGAVVGHSTLRIDGSWAMAGLPPGLVSVGFAGCHGNAVYVPEWYDDVASHAEATPVTVSATAATTQVDAELARYGGLHFAFYDSAGARVSGVCAWITDPTGTTLVAVGYDPGPDVVVEGLQPGPYSVLFTDCGENGFAPEWFEDAATHGASTPVVALDGENTRHPVTL